MNTWPVGDRLSIVVAMVYELNNQLHAMPDRWPSTLKPVIVPKLIFKSVVWELTKQFPMDTML